MEGLVSAIDILFLPSILYLDLLKFQLDDTIVKSIEAAPNSELKKSKDIIQRIRRRELYKVVHLKNKLNQPFYKVLQCAHEK